MLDKMGNKQTKPGESKSAEGYVPGVNNGNPKTGESEQEKMLRLEVRRLVIDMIKREYPELMARGKKEEIEEAIEQAIAAGSNIISQTVEITSGDMDKEMARMKELTAAPNNVSRAKITERHKAENRERERAKMTPEQLAENNAVQQEFEKLQKEIGAKGGRRHKKSRKGRKINKSRRSSSRRRT